MRRYLLCAAVLLLCGCVHAGEPAVGEPAPGEPAHASRGAERPAWKRSCESYTSGQAVEVDYQDAPGGVSVLYRAPGAEAGLRTRALEVARFHNRAGLKTDVLHDLSSIPHRAHVEDIEGGVRLVLVPKTLLQSDLERLRWSVQQDVFAMQKHGCQRGHEGL